MTRKEETYLCIKNLKARILKEAKEIDNGFVSEYDNRTADKNKTSLYWCQRLRESISDLENYIEENNSL